MGSRGGGKVNLFKNNLFPIHHPEIFVINPICYAETINHLGWGWETRERHDQGRGDPNEKGVTTKGGAVERKGAAARRARV